MPTYIYGCPHCQRRIEHVMSVKALPGASFLCGVCDVGMELVIGAPLLVKAAPNVAYDSPIDGRHITSWDMRREDLKRHGCREYDPEMKTDHANRIKESEKALDATIEAHVEEAIEKMPTAKRGKLYSELTDQGVQAEVIRTTPDA